MISPWYHLAYMIVISAILGYLLMTILINSNITANRNKIYNALLMGFMMGLVTVPLLELPTSQKWMVALPLAATSGLFIFMIKSQIAINDKEFAKSMIEHHQMAIGMAEPIQNKTTNPFIAKLASNIISSQQKEIDEMKCFLTM